MKIKLSKSQWEQVGKTAGWLKTANDYESCECWECGKRVPKKSITKLHGHEICKSCFESEKGDYLRDMAKDKNDK